MSYTRNIKFRYYTMTSKILQKNKWVNNGPFNFVGWLMDFDKKYGKSSIEFDGVRARVDEFVYDDENKIWAVRFMKLRDDNIPSKVKENEEAETIELEDDEYIGEDVTLLYDEKTGISMIQSNRFALGISKIERFIDNTPIVKDEQVSINPISTQVDIRNYRRNNYRQVELKFANLNRLVPENEKTALGDILKSFNKFGAISGTITIGLGRSKFKSLRKAEVEASFAEISDNPNIEGAKLKVRDDDDTPIEVVDLFDNVDNDIITFELESRETLGFQKAVSAMLGMFLMKLPELKTKIMVFD